MAIIHFVDGEKGGVGKTWVSRTLIQYFLELEIPFHAVETDRSNPMLSKVYPETQFAVFTENEKKADLADVIFDLGLERPTVVNLPSQVHRPLSAWIDTKGLIELGKEHGVSFQKWFVCDGESDSIQLFLISLEHFQGQVPHVLVKNQGRCDDWEFFDGHEELQKAIKKHKVKVVEFPKLSDRLRIQMNAHSLSFGEARGYQPFGIIGKSEVKRYLEKAYAAFKAGGI